MFKVIIYFFFLWHSLKLFQWLNNYLDQTHAGLVHSPACFWLLGQENRWCCYSSFFAGLHQNTLESVLENNIVQYMLFDSRCSFKCRRDVRFFAEKHRTAYLFYFLSANLTKASNTVKTWTFTVTCKLGSPRKKPEALVKFLQQPWGFSMCRGGAGCFSRMQPETESHASLESVHSEVRCVVVTAPWDRSVTGRDMVQADPCTGQHCFVNAVEQTMEFCKHRVTLICW